MRDFNTALPCVHCNFTWGEVERKYLFSQDSTESHYKPVQTFWRFHVLKRKEKTPRLIAQRALSAFCMHKGPTHQILAEVFSETEPNSAKVHQYTRPVRRLHAADFLHDLQLTLLSHHVLPFGWRTLIGWGGYSQACSCEGSVNGPRARRGGACKQVEHRQLWPGGRSRIHADSHTHMHNSRVWKQTCMTESQTNV